MTIEETKLVFKCDDCPKTFKLKPELAGRRVKCPCGTVIRVPMQEVDPLSSFSEIDLEPLPVENSYPTRKVAKPRTKRTGREWWTLIGGWAAAAFAGLFCILAVVNLFVSGFDPLQFLAILSLSAFPGLLAVACLVPKYRHITIRIVGGIMCVVCTIGFFGALNDPEASEHVRRKGILIVMAIAMAGVAIKGRWPFGDEKE